MNINVLCPGCAQNLQVKDELIGRGVKCPGCGRVFTVSAQGQPTSSPGAPPSPGASPTALVAVGSVPGQSKSEASGSFRRPRLPTLVAFLLAAMGLLVPVPPYLFWYRPARHALDEKKAEHELRKLDAKAASQQEDILRLKQIAIRAVDREQAKVFELQIKEASEVTQEKRQRANDFGSRMYQHEGEAFYRAEHITMWVMLIGVGLALLGLTCGLIQALRAQVMWGMLVGIAVGVLLGAAAGNFWAGYGNYHDPLVLFAGVGLFVGIICGLVVRRRAKAAGS